MFDLSKIVRQNIQQLKPYSSARDEFEGTADVYLDANENSFGSVLKAYHRYPDPLQRNLKKQIAELKRVPAEKIFLGNGSDECIDLLYRCFCNPGKDNVIISQPTYGMYEVSANINDIAVKNIPLTAEFALDEAAITKAIDTATKIIWCCSPNNPTGNNLDATVMERLARGFDGLLVVDEAYADFSSAGSFTSRLEQLPNVVVLQTFSKAWGLAGLRLGMAFASPEIIAVFNKVKPPYNINEATQLKVAKALQHAGEVQKMIDRLVKGRAWLQEQLQLQEGILQVFPSAANFLLVRCESSRELYHYLLKAGVVVRDRSSALHCEGCLRITIGTDAENTLLVNTIQSFYKL